MSTPIRVCNICWLAIVIVWLLHFTPLANPRRMYDRKLRLYNHSCILGKFHFTSRLVIYHRRIQRIQLFEFWLWFYTLKTKTKNGFKTGSDSKPSFRSLLFERLNMVMWCKLCRSYKTLFNRYLHSMDTYIQWIPTLNGYLHWMDTYIQWIPTFNGYLHSMYTYIQ